MKKYKIKLGDCLDVMSTIKENGVDAIVCDPPYGLSFMGREWDHGVPGVPFWEAALKVVKPGAHLLAFGGTRTHHRLMVAIEDAGWEIRDCLMWLYGSGFPKGHDVSKAIDKHLGKEREVIGSKLGQPGYSHANNGRTNKVYGDLHDPIGECAITAPATPEAVLWQGFNTNLKPAWEPIIMARKPLSEPTIAANVLRWHGCGAINIDATRIGTDDDRGRPPRTPNAIYGNGNGTNHTPSESHPQGRWPSNLLLSDEAAHLLDEQSGTLKSGNLPALRGRSQQRNLYSSYQGSEMVKSYAENKGGASRFFYCAKASKSDRGEGNDWPTVKPTSLMRYLCKLITPPNGIILDPFMGSGSTGKAALLENFLFYGIDSDEHAVEISTRRLQDIVDQLSQEA